MCCDKFCCHGGDHLKGEQLLLKLWKRLHSVSQRCSQNCWFWSFTHAGWHLSHWFFLGSIRCVTCQDGQQPLRDIKTLWRFVSFLHSCRFRRPKSIAEPDALLVNFKQHMHLTGVNLEISLNFSWILHRSKRVVKRMASHAPTKHILPMWLMSSTCLQSDLPHSWHVHQNMLSIRWCTSCRQPSCWALNPQQWPGFKACTPRHPI